jgi:DnaJ-class molecular chaperone
MAPVPITEDYYMVLEVVQTATPEQVIRSYKQLALKLHPDRNAKRDTTEAFQLVSSVNLVDQCYYILSQYHSTTDILAE